MLLRNVVNLGTIITYEQIFRSKQGEYRWEKQKF